jgi:hypothetical protein
MTSIRHHIRPFYLLYLFFLVIITACGVPATPILPTAYVVRSGVAVTTPRTPTIPARPTNPPQVTPTSLPSATAALDTPLDQYRSWMQEARATHPYGEPIELMWEVMLCESSGEADQVAGSYYGLFQYKQATWAGNWNSYRTSSILDPRAQIFATAKAWQDGNQHWWGCYHQ